MLHNGVIVAVACAATCGCSSMNLQGDAPPEDRVFVTGSHLPSKAGTGANSVKTLAPPPFDQTMRGQNCVGGQLCGAGN